DLPAHVVAHGCPESLIEQPQRRPPAPEPRQHRVVLELRVLVVERLGDPRLGHLDGQPLAGRARVLDGHVLLAVLVFVIMIVVVVMMVTVMVVVLVAVVVAVLVGVLVHVLLAVRVRVFTFCHGAAPALGRESSGVWNKWGACRPTPGAADKGAPVPRQAEVL